MFIKTIFFRVFKIQWVQHLGFWMLSYYILLNVLRLSNEIQKIDLIYTSLFLINILAVVYVNLKILIPRFLARKKYVWFSILGVLNLLLFSDLNIWLFNHFVDYLLPNYYFISYYELEDIMKFHLAFLVLTTLIKLSKAWFKMQETEKKIARAHEEKTMAELNALKSQINPHFLFNSLSNIHALVLKKSDDSAASIILLSDMMRYVLYETKADFVKLSDEVNFLKNLVELQRLRLQEESEIVFKIDIENEKVRIAPLLLLPFFENSFKHGLKADVGKTFAYFNIESDRNALNFIARNNNGSKSLADKSRSGVGLANVKRRLDLLYPDNYQLNISDENGVFEISLKLALNEQKNNIRCILVEDEPLSAETLENYILDFPGIELVAKCRDSFEALEAIKQEKIDLMFLDINLPKLSGLSLLKSLENPPQVVFTTAYSEHAVEGFELDATDYLLKPFSFERFVKAVNKVFDRVNSVETGIKTDIDFLSIKSDKRIFRLKLSEIKYFQSSGDYIKVVCQNKTIVSHQTLKGIALMISKDEFIQIHKSYIISLKHISFVEGNQVKVEDEFLPIGNTYKENLLGRLKANTDK